MSLGLVFGTGLDSPHPHPHPPPSYDPNCTKGEAWVWDIFHECVLNNVQYAGFFLGLISILCWLVVFIPQFYDAYKSGKMDEGISPIFLFFWFLGDVSNLVGSLLSKQLGTQIAVAYYYIAMDLLVLMQFTYYYLKNKKRKQMHGELRESYNSMSKSNRSHVVYCAGGLLVLVGTSWFSLSPWQQAAAVHGGSWGVGRTLLSVDDWDDKPCKIQYLNTVDCFLENDTEIIGYACGCVSAFFYLASRAPQIYKNYKRKSVEGVAVMMFVLTVLGNVFYGLSIVMEDTSSLFLMRHFPWLVGSLGTLTFDCMVLVQFRLYGGAKPDGSDINSEENRGLLTPNVRSDDEGFYRAPPQAEA